MGSNKWQVDWLRDGSHYIVHFFQKYLEIKGIKITWGSILECWKHMYVYFRYSGLRPSKGLGATWKTLENANMGVRKMKRIYERLKILKLQFSAVHIVGVFSACANIFFWKNEIDGANTPAKFQVDCDKTDGVISI